MAWSRSVSAVARALAELGADAGGAADRRAVAPGGDDSSVDLVREVARSRAGRRTSSTRRSPFPTRPRPGRCAGSPRWRGRSAAARSVTKAVAGIGLWEPGQSTLYDAA